MRVIRGGVWLIPFRPSPLLASRAASDKRVNGEPEAKLG